MKHACLALAAVISLVSGNAIAQQTLTVEVLAFEQPDGRASDPALWTFDATPPPPLDTQPAQQAATGALDTARSRLAANGYRTVSHVAWQQSVMSQANARPTPVPPGQAGAGSLGGYLRVWRGRYLHIDADLHYSDGSGVTREGRLRDSRKVTAGTPVYLDHDLFGVLVYLRR